jgi:hypothetical protein
MRLAGDGVLPLRQVLFFSVTLSIITCLSVLKKILLDEGNDLIVAEVPS